MNILARLILLILLFLTSQTGIASTTKYTVHQYDVILAVPSGEVYGYDTNTNPSDCCQISSVVNTQDRSILAFVSNFLATKRTPKITKAYKRPSGATTKVQRESVQGKPCVDCGATTSRQVADHKDPLVKEYYRTGTIDKARMRDVDSVQPQCPTCSARQGAEMSRFSRQMKKEHGLE